MEKEKFNEWLIKEKGQEKKVASDIISRLKRIMRELDCNIDDEYQLDRFENLLSFFENNGNNEKMKKRDTSFPIGKYHIGVYRYAIRKYSEFKDLDK